MNKIYFFISILVAQSVLGLGLGMSGGGASFVNNAIRPATSGGSKAPQECELNETDTIKKTTQFRITLKDFPREYDAETIYLYAYFCGRSRCHIVSNYTKLSPDLLDKTVSLTPAPSIACQLNYPHPKKPQSFYFELSMERKGYLKNFIKPYKLGTNQLALEAGKKINHYVPLNSTSTVKILVTQED